MRKIPYKALLRPLSFQLLLIIGILAISVFIGVTKLEEKIMYLLGNHLNNSAAIITATFPSGAITESWCRDKISPTPLRLTVITRDGQVICDSHSSIAKMDNHLSRPEVSSALKQGTGEAIRISSSLGNSYIYAARRSQDGNFVIRVAESTASFQQFFSQFKNSILFILIAIATVLSGFAIWSAHHLIAPLSQVLDRVEYLLNSSLRSNVKRSKELDQAVDIDHNEHLQLGNIAHGEWSDLEALLENLETTMREKDMYMSRNQEEQLALMSALSDAVIAIDQREKILFFNSRFAVIFASKIRALGANRQTLTDLVRSPAVLELFRTAISSKASTTSKGVTVDNATREYYSIHVSPLKDHSGEIYGAIGVFHDVTELKLAEQMRIDFVANVSHELRTPLTSIKGYAETLLSDFSQPKAQVLPEWLEFMQIIVKNSNRLIHLINDLLDISVLESTTGIQKTTINTQLLSDRIVGKLDYAFTAKLHQISVLCEMTEVFADEARLEQVLINLLDNAIKYTPESGHITLRWSYRADSHCTELAVIDNGAGIPPEHHTRLFERFYRVDKGRSREMGGTGLGLAIVKHIVQGHGGSITVNSHPSKGSEFLCLFPLPVTQNKESS